MRARRKYDALRRMTVDRGCSVEEADTAARLAAELDRRWGFAGAPATPPHDPGFERRHRAQERAAAQRWRWEYRRCGKPRCWCMRTASAPGHGPYKYAKRREGKLVRSIYLGR